MSRILLWLVALQSAFFISSLALSYGKFRMLMTGTGSCKGPRRRDCSNVSYELAPDGQSIHVYGDVLEETTLEVVRVMGYNNDGRKRAATLVDVKMERPCQQNTLVKKFFSEFLDENCVIQKKTLNFSLDANKLSNSLWAGSFFYGNFTFHTAYYGRRCNLGCNDLNVTYLPA